MKTIYSLIFSRFTKQSFIPIILIEFFLIISLFLLNEYQVEQNKQTLLTTQQTAFVAIANSTSNLISRQFDKEKEFLNIIAASSQQQFANVPEHLQANQFIYTKGFFAHPLENNSSQASVYSTNLTTLEKEDLTILTSLVYLYPIVKSSVDIKDDLISSTWINIGSKYSLIYPSITLGREVASDFNATKYAFYYLADAQHNPSKSTLFIPLYSQPWAMKAGEIGAYIAPLYLHDKMIGVSGVTLHVSALFSSLKLMKLPTDSLAMILDENNHIILSTDNQKTLAIFKAQSFYQNFQDQKSNDLTSINTALLQDSIFYESNISKTSLKLFIFIDKKDLFADISKIHSNTIYAGIIFILLMLILHTILLLYTKGKIKNLANSISKPLQEIVNFSDVLGQKEEVSLQDNSIEELNKLLLNLNQTHEYLLNKMIYDEQTHLYNRRKLYEDLDKIDTLLLFSIHNYKTLAEIYGDETASQLLLSEVTLIKDQEGITPYRISEDEFALAFQGQPNSNIKSIQI